MSGLNAAANTIRSWAERYKELLDLAALMQRLGSLENVESEQNARAQAARSNAEAEERRFLEIQAASKGVMSDAKKGSASIVSEAQDAAKAVLETAREQAAGLVAKAQAQKADIEAQAAQRESQANEAQAKVTVAQTELATLEAKIATAKAQIVKILG